MFSALPLRTYVVSLFGVIVAATTFAAEAVGYTSTKHQHEVGTGYFDVISEIVSQGQSSTKALKGSTEEDQFH